MIPYRFALVCVAALASLSCVSTHTTTSASGSMIRAEMVEIVNKEGKVVARLGVGDDGTANLWLVDNNGNAHPQFESMGALELSMGLVTTLKTAISDVAKRQEHKATRITVSHILISFSGSGVPGVTRTLQEAEVVAAQVYKRVVDGEDFNALLKEFSDDTGGGTYTMTMNVPGAEPPTDTPGENVYARNNMVPAFGDVGWKLEIGQVGVAAFDKGKSPYGYHIIKRIE